MNEKEELAHLTAPSSDPKQRMIDYWGRRAERAEAEIERLRAALEDIALEALAQEGAGVILIKARRALEGKDASQR
jgi:hypothetical protein